MDLKMLLSSIPPPPPPPPSPPLFQSTGGGSNLSSNVSPSVLLIIIILAIIFFISGLTHLLVRLLVKPSNRDPDEFDNVTALQGQLQQLFTLHDSGVDQSNLVFEYSPNTCCSPFVLVLESGSGESSREIVDDTTIQRVSVDVHRDEESEFGPSDLGQSEVKEDESKEKVVTVKLGKFENVDGGVEDGDEKRKIDGRRCFSMGSFEYVMDDNSSLHVQLRTQIKKQSRKKQAMSECGGDSRRDFKGIEAFRSASGGSIRRESFSVSKIWLRGKKENANSTVEPPPTGAFSLQFLLRQNVAGDDESRAADVGCDDQEVPSGNNLDPQAASNPPSLAKRILIWLMCRQKNKVVHSSLSINV
ncbi:hypothetical protein L1987_77699 [Smallanthus sonchifolius]|uniref:Uncharacterized protein n=1 Tax=Smallanthus sonchifolius TaxID=185202 RepID=A0ACB8ZAP9_9ASTR|nr:hypothetical protein L1987_77699 [Smallanthus sonchifolius]